MPACVRTPERASVLFLLVLLLALTACSDPQADGHFKLRHVEAKWTNGWMNVTFDQRLALSNEARDALIHGVPLTVQLELLLRNAGSQIRVGNETNSYEIRYLPLSDYYQLSLSGADTIRTFPRLRHVLAELSSLNVSFETGVLPAGDYELLARTRLDQRRMPPPMRLPILLSSKWRHDSDWSSWPLEIEPET